MFIIRAGRLNKAGKANLMIRITIDKKFTEFSSKMSVSPEHWDAKMGRMKGRSVGSLEVNKAIDFMLTRLNNQYLIILEKDGYVTAEKLRDYFLGFGESKNTLLVLFDKKIEQKKALSGKYILESAVGKYECTIKYTIKLALQLIILSFVIIRILDKSEPGD